MKIHENSLSLEAVLFIQESTMTFENAGILCVDFLVWFFSFVYFACFHTCAAVEHMC